MLGQKFLKKIFSFLLSREYKIPPTSDINLQDIYKHINTNQDGISDHLPLIYIEGLKIKPSLIVELGVRGGESTFVFEKIARKCDSYLISNDIEEIDFTIEHDKWFFVRMDDIQFSENFKKFTNENAIPNEIDLLFIDTSHLYEHTKEEIGTWFRHLSKKGTVIFHDTNLTKIYKRINKTIGAGWDNDRGVIRALEDFFKVKFDEKKYFQTILSEFIIEHYPNCSGLTIIKKIMV